MDNLTLRHNGELHRFGSIEQKEIFIFNNPGDFIEHFETQSKANAFMRDLDKSAYQLDGYGVDSRNVAYPYYVAYHSEKEEKICV